MTQSFQSYGVHERSNWSSHITVVIEVVEVIIAQFNERVHRGCLVTDVLSLLF